MEQFNNIFLKTKKHMWKKLYVIKLLNKKYLYDESQIPRTNNATISLEVENEHSSINCFENEDSFYVY